MIPIKQDASNYNFYLLNNNANEKKRRTALLERCNQYRLNIQKRNPGELASMAAMSIRHESDGSIILNGEHFNETYMLKWPELTIIDSRGKAASRQTEVLWLHYLDRADGFPLARRWVNLSEIGGLFYQQAFQGYCGDELAKSWGSNIEGLEQRCLDKGGWSLSGLADLAFEWRALPRFPLCICYRLSGESAEAWATVLFDASASHYVAADVAAIVGKNLVDQLKL